MKLERTIIFLVYFCVPMAYANDLDNDIPEIALDSEQVLLSGIQTTKLTPIPHQVEFLTFGKAVSLLPLIELQHRYLATLSEQERAIAKFTDSQKTSKRQLDLYNFGIASKQKLQSQQTQLQTDKTTLDANRFQDQAIIYEAKLKWGDTISHWLLSKDNSELNPFLEGKQTLLLVTSPVIRPLPDNIKSIYVGLSGNRIDAKMAELISPAPLSDEARQGYSYFFKTEHASIKPGMNISAWIPTMETGTGVLIPQSAVIWKNDKAYVYKKIKEDSFKRILLQHFSILSDGYSTTEVLKPNDEIVTVGSQILLSEELREQIQDED